MRICVYTHALIYSHTSSGVGSSDDPATFVEATPILRAKISRGLRRCSDKMKPSGRGWPQGEKGVIFRISAESKLDSKRLAHQKAVLGGGGDLGDPGTLVGTGMPSLAQLDD